MLDISIINSIAKMKLSDLEKDCLYHYFTLDNFGFNDFEFFIKHKIQYLLVKHILDLGLITQINKNLAIVLSEQLSFLQLRVQEYESIMKNLSKEFCRNNIKYAVLKGFSLLNELYNFNGIYYRRFNDVDLLIAKEDISKATTILNENGFIQGRIKEGNRLVPASRRELIFWSLNSHQEHKFVSQSQFTKFSRRLYNAIDINFTIFEGGKQEPLIATKELLNNTRIQTFHEFSFSSLSYTYEFLQLCYNFYKDTQYDIKKRTHDNICLIKFCDIHEYYLKHHKNIDWILLSKIATDFHISDELYSVLNMVVAFYHDFLLQEQLITMGYFNNIPEYDFNLLLN